MTKNNTDKASKKIYVVFDERAIYAQDEAMVMEACESLDEVRGCAGEYGKFVVVYSYDDKDGELVNGKEIGILDEDGKFLHEK